MLLEVANYCRGGNVRNNVLYRTPDINQNVFLSGIADSSIPIGITCFIKMKGKYDY